MQCAGYLLEVCATTCGGDSVVMKFVVVVRGSPFTAWFECGASSRRCLDHPFSSYDYMLGRTICRNSMEWMRGKIPDDADYGYF